VNKDFELIILRLPQRQEILFSSVIQLRTNKILQFRPASSRPSAPPVAVCYYAEAVSSTVNYYLHVLDVLYVVGSTKTAGGQVDSGKSFLFFIFLRHAAIQSVIYAAVNLSVRPFVLHIVCCAETT